MKNKYLQLAICLLLPLIVGSFAGIVTSTNIPTWFPTIIKPSWNPPNYLFAPVWTMLYLLMGYGWYRILQVEKSDIRTKALNFFYVQWGLNFLWSFLFFQFHTLGFAFIEIILLWSTIALMIYYFYKLDKLSGLLQVPYILWVSFASVLNGTIWYLNK